MASFSPLAELLARLRILLLPAPSSADLLLVTQVGAEYYAAFQQRMPRIAACNLCPHNAVL